MDGGNNSGATPTAAPAAAPMPNANAPPPFLSKTYDMVDDPSSDAIVSWSSTNNSFVVWNPPEFARDLLPKYFKHNNFSSFVRQLNTYQLDGSEEDNLTKKAILRKVDPDRWEFANEGFLRGQKHLLKSITRRKPAQGHNHQQAQQSHGQSSSVGSCVEVGKFGLEEEVERLKRDKNVLMQELVRLRQHQQSTDNQMQQMVKQLQGMEKRQQKMMSFLAKSVQSPGFLAQFVQQQNESNRRITEANKKRRLKQEGIAETERATAPDGQIVKYQPLMNEAAKAMLRQIMKLDTSRVDSFNNNSENYLIGDGPTSSNAMDSGSTSNRSCGVTLQEVPPTSVNAPTAGNFETQSSPRSAASEKVTTAQYPNVDLLVGASDAPSLPLSDLDVIMPELSPIPEIVTGGVLDIPEENFMGPETGNDGYMDPTSLGVNGSLPIDIGNISPDTDIDDLLDNSSFWEDFMQSPLSEEFETDAAKLSNGNDMQPKENGWDKVEHMDQLTEQMGLLSSDAKRV